MQTTLQHTIKVFIRQGEKFFTAECLEVPVVTQSRTIDETVANIKEALALHIEDENLEQYGLAPNPVLLNNGDGGSGECRLNSSSYQEKKFSPPSQNSAFQFRNKYFQQI